jgi:drug/metabolite transporter (DMT)-like permease
MFTTKQKAYIALSITSIFWGTTWVAMKFGIKQMPPLQLAGIRQFLAGCLFVSFLMIKGEKLPKGNEWFKLLVMAILTFTFANGLSTWSLNYISSGLGALIGTLYPLCVVVIERIFLKNKNINLTTIVGIVLGIIGIGAVFYDNAFFTPHGTGYFFGIMLALFAMLSWSISTILVSRKYVTINPYLGMGWQMIISSFIVYVWSITTEKTVPFTQINTQSWLTIFYLIIVGSVIAVIAFIYTMKHLEPALASIYAYINPIVALLIGSFLLKEEITLLIIIGSLITLFGVFLVRKSLKKIPIPDEEI